MRRSLKELLGYKIKAIDGSKGHVKDFLFDENQWIINYLQAQLGNLFVNKQVIIPRMFWKNPSWINEEFQVGVGKAEIEKCPDLEEHLPVSKKYETKLIKYYQAQTHLSSYTPAPVVALAPAYVPEAKYTFNNLDSTNEPVLRSLNEVLGYSILTKDGKIGSLYDLIVDDRNWKIIYAVIDTDRLVPWSKKVLISISWLEQINYNQQHLKINLTTEKLLNGYEYHSSDPINEVYQKRKFDYLGRPVEK